MDIQTRTSTLVLSLLLMFLIGCRGEKSNPEALFRLGNVSFENADYDAAVEYYTQAIKETPNAAIFHNRALAWDAKGEFSKAIEDFNRSIEKLPHEAAYNDRGITWLALEEYEKAESDFTRAIRLSPEFDLPYQNRGSVRSKLNNYSGAFQDLNRAIDLNNANSLAYANRAWLYATASSMEHRDSRLALQDARKACEMVETPTPFHLETLAAAYAATGEFEKAAQWQQKAIDSSIEADDSSAMRERLTLYGEGLAYYQDSTSK